jgi:hypothetical protein
MLELKLKNSEITENEYEQAVEYLDKKWIKTEYDSAMFKSIMNVNKPSLLIGKSIN